jgi:hypothetical protein
VAKAEADAKRLAEEAESDAKRRIASAQAEAERVTAESKRQAQERLSQAVAAARVAAEEKLREAETTAMEWVAAAEAEAERVAQAHIVMANQSSRDFPLTSSSPSVSEFVDEKSAPDSADDEPQEVSEEDGALAPSTKRRVVRRK